MCSPKPAHIVENLMSHALAITCMFAFSHNYMYKSINRHCQFLRDHEINEQLF